MPWLFDRDMEYDVHRVTVDRPRRLVTMTAVGFFTTEAMQEAAVDLHAAIQSLGPDAGRHVTLYDLRALQVASADTIDHFRGYFTDPAFASIWARKVAFVTRSALMTLQARRVQEGHDHIRVFGDRDEAVAWLLS